jgi:release factor glutamine methyltransferase
MGQFDVILANPPYVETGAELFPAVRDHEPAGALFAGPDGLDDYRALIPQLPPLLSENGIAVLEIGATQGDAVTEIAEAAGFFVQLHKDLASRPRALVLRFGLGKSRPAH